MNIYSPRLDVRPRGPAGINKIVTADDTLGIFGEML
jgi:hypothetical protein